MRLIVAITGASGIIYSKRLLEVLKGENEVHLIISKASEKLIEYELGISKNNLEELANRVYQEDDFFSPLASGSFISDLQPPPSFYGPRQKIG